MDSSGVSASKRFSSISKSLSLSDMHQACIRWCLSIAGGPSWADQAVRRTQAAGKSGDYAGCPTWDKAKMTSTLLASCNMREAFQCVDEKAEHKQLREWTRRRC